MPSGNDTDTTVVPEIVWFSIFSMSINFVLIYFSFSRPEEFSKVLGRRTPADRVQGTISLVVTVIEPNRIPSGTPTYSLHLTQKSYVIFLAWYCALYVTNRLHGT